MASPETQYEDSLDRLIALLDSVIQEQVDHSLAESMQRIRRLALERRAGFPEAESRLIGELKRLELPELRSVIRWLSLFFDLANLVEELKRIRTLHRRQRAASESGQPRSESIAEAITQLKAAGYTAAEIQQWLYKLRIEPVFTAHPSEAKRRTTRQLLRRLREQLPTLLESQSNAIEKQFLADLTVLWQSDLVRPHRPPVMSEVSRGLFFASTLWHVVPAIYRELRIALADAYPHHRFDVPCFIAFGSWIGGDRDGHPFVTAEVTRQTLGRLRRAGLENHLDECRAMLRRLVMSDGQVPSDDRLKQQIEDAVRRLPRLGERIEQLSEAETYRRFLKLIEYRLERNLAQLEAPEDADAGYANTDEFRSDLQLLMQSVADNRGRRIAESLIQPWLDQVDTFGFHFAALDIRQNSAIHQKCYEELLQQLNVSGEDGLSTTFGVLDAPISIDRDRLSAEAREVLDTFLLLADEVAHWGLRSFGGYVISMTHSAQDVMTALWLWKAAWRMRHDDLPLPSLPIVPLFETIDDLQRAGEIMHELFQSPLYRDYVTTDSAVRQMVMIGYSDSTKDGGYLSACWELYKTQQELAKIAADNHIELTIFHGRGGSLGRGGGPAARAIRSLPAKAVGGRLRVTEQGEVLAERYDDPRIAHRHLEQVVSATLLVSIQDDQHPEPGWAEAMELMAQTSFSSYRRLLEHPGFLSYFDQATPIGAIETLPIGSRPARRGKRKTLGDLRAIPWTFAWTQSRHLLPAWYGFGAAVQEYISAHDQDWSLLQAMYQRWPMFRALVDNAELALAKADMKIAHHYAQLSDHPGAEDVWKQISTEFDRSRGAVLIITGRPELLGGTEWLRRAIQVRNPYVDPLNLAQVDLLARQDDAENEDLNDLLRLTIQGIASGLRTTG